MLVIYFGAHSKSVVRYMIAKLALSVIKGLNLITVLCSSSEIITVHHRQKKKKKKKNPAYGRQSIA